MCSDVKFERSVLCLVERSRIGLPSLEVSQQVLSQREVIRRDEEGSKIYLRQ